jgi:hypothetical protein
VAWEKCSMVHDRGCSPVAASCPARRPRRSARHAHHAADPLAHTHQPKVGTLLAAEAKLHRGQRDHHCRGQHRQRDVDPQQQRPRGHEPDRGNPPPTRGLVPPASQESAASPVRVSVSTVVVTSATARPVTRVGSDSASNSGSTRGAGSGRCEPASTASAHSPTAGHGSSGHDRRSCRLTRPNSTISRRSEPFS